MKDDIELVIDYPANIASFLTDHQVDIGLVPVAVMPSLKEHYIISDYCIGCDGEVGSVCLFSEVELRDIKTILLDYQSRTSVELLKILLKEHWGISPKLINATANYENLVHGTTAGLVIGDRALKQRARSKYNYDLGWAWKELTGLPFVFAAWLSNKKMPAQFIADFNKANEMGLHSLELIVQQNLHHGYDLHHYYTENISYQFDEKKKEGMQLFLKKLILNS